MIKSIRDWKKLFIKKKLGLFRLLRTPKTFRSIKVINIILISKKSINKNSKIKIFKSENIHNIKS